MRITLARLLQMGAVPVLVLASMTFDATKANAELIRPDDPLWAPTYGLVNYTGPSIYSKIDEWETITQLILEANWEAEDLMSDYDSVAWYAWYWFSVLPPQDKLFRLDAGALIPLN